MKTDTFSLDQYTDVLLYKTQIKLNEIEGYNCYQITYKLYTKISNGLEQLLGYVPCLCSHLPLLT